MDVLGVPPLTSRVVVFSLVVLMLCSVTSVQSVQSVQAVQSECSCSQCNTDTNDHVYDLQARVTCLEMNMEELRHENHPDFIRDCSEVPERGEGGVYQIHPEGAPHPFNVTCKFDTEGKWTILQQRRDGSTNFFRSWVEYKKGFGTNGLDTNLWLGLDYMHQITSQRQYMLRVNLIDFEDVERYAEYSMFWIGDEDSGYQLHIAGHSGNLPDKFTAALGMKFSTADQDNDLRSSNCALSHPSGWWQKSCYHVNLNGEYRVPPDHKTTNGIQWFQAKGRWYSMKESYMLIKPAFSD